MITPTRPSPPPPTAIGPPPKLPPPIPLRSSTWDGSSRAPGLNLMAREPTDSNAYSTHQGLLSVLYLHYADEQSEQTDHSRGRRRGARPRRRRGRGGPQHEPLPRRLLHSEDGNGQDHPGLAEDA